MIARLAAFFRSFLRWVLTLYVAGLSSLFFLVLLIAGTPVGEWLEDAQREGAVSFENLRTAEVVVILGGDEGTRVIGAEKVYRSGKARRVVVSADEDFLLEALAAGGIPRSKIYVDTLPKRTIDHPQTILELPGITRETHLIVTSSRLQERRAKFLFDRAGFKDVQVYSLERDREMFRREHPEKFPPARWHFERVYTIAYAYLAWVKYFIVD